MIVMKDGSDLQGLLNHVNAEMLELQQEYMNLEQENMDKEGENAKLRKKLSEKHDDNCRLQRQLAEQHNILMDAYKSLEDLELSTLSANSRMSNAEVKVDDLAEENRILLSKLRYLDTLQRVEKFEEAYESPTPKEFSGEELSMRCRMDSLEQQLEQLRRNQKGVVSRYRDRHGRWREES